MMFNLGERVQHLDTGNIGIVVGYGKRIVDRQCLPTVKVKIISPDLSNKITIKDLDSKWLSTPEDYRFLYPNAVSRHLVIKPAKRYDLPRSA